MVLHLQLCADYHNGYSILTNLQHLAILGLRDFAQPLVQLNGVHIHNRFQLLIACILNSGIIPPICS